MKSDSHCQVVVKGLPGMVLIATLAACQPSAGSAELPGNSEDAAPFAEIGAEATLRFLGNEPFWGGEARGTSLTYSTPENTDGTTITVSRFAGRGGLTLSGSLEGRSFDMTVTPGDCSDTMSDRSYPLVVTLRLGEEVRNGCGWTDRQPFTGPEEP